uniref:Fibroin-like protein n=1 Tax=Oryza sativa subsp. japonica TaxID=39947 RepID=Q6YX24_ORYSJ|nr:fibroin-like protein [Oryza sativa Japonica Group]
MTVAGGGDQARQHADVAAREKSEGCAGSGLAEPVWCCDAHAVTRDPMVTGGARTAALGGGGSGDTARRQRRRPTALGQPGGGHGDPRERGGERNRRERSRRRWIAAAAITGDQKGKTRRDDEGSIQRGGSISGVQGIRFRRRIGRSGTEIGWRREAASGTEQERVASYGERRRARRIARQEEDYGGELTNRRGGSIGGAVGVAARCSRRRGGTAPRGRGRGRREGEVVPGAPRHPRTGSSGASATDGNGESGTSSNKAATVVRRQWRGGCED